jgi:hypothetical protein
MAHWYSSFPRNNIYYKKDREEQYYEKIIDYYQQMCLYSCGVLYQNLFFYFFVAFVHVFYLCLYVCGRAANMRQSRKPVFSVRQSGRNKARNKKTDVKKYFPLEKISSFVKKKLFSCFIFNLQHGHLLIDRVGSHLLHHLNSFNHLFEEMM